MNDNKCPFCGEPVVSTSIRFDRFRCGTEGPFFEDGKEKYRTGWVCDMRMYQRLLAAKDAEIERLRAIVDRLPKTADGVPIAKGTIIYQAAGAYNMLEHEVSGWQFADDGSLKILMFGRGWTAFCDGWYSTRELAEAARTEVGE